MKLQLRGCPFCNCEPGLHRYGKEAGDMQVMIACDNDDCWSRPSVHARAIVEAAERWNRRPGLQSMTYEIDTQAKD